MLGDPFGTPGMVHRPSRHHPGWEAEPKKRLIIKDTEITRAERKKKSLQTESVVQKQIPTPEGICWALPRENNGKEILGILCPDLLLCCKG